MMKKPVIILIALIAALPAIMLVSCRSSRVETAKVNHSVVQTGSPDGSSYEKAVKVNSVEEEYQWLDSQFPGYRIVKQALSDYRKKYYDIFTIVTTEGVQKDVYFDITAFFGKF